MDYFNNDCPSFPRIVDAGIELESLCRAEISSGNNVNNTPILGFPPLCLRIVRLLAGNQCCVDCGKDLSDDFVCASIGYGTMLCHDCAQRHMLLTPDESDVGHLRNHHWNLRSTLVMFEGGNTNMLDYVKNKPQWKPPKGKANESEDVLAFKQVYLSQAALVYRKELAKRAETVFNCRINVMREEDAAKELLQSMDFSRLDPIQRILEKNNMSGDEIPGLFNAADAVEGDRADSSETKRAGPMTKLGRVYNAPMIKREAPSIEIIKDRINRRRAMIPSIDEFEHAPSVGADEPGRTDMLPYHVNSSLEDQTIPSADAFATQRYR